MPLLGVVFFLAISFEKGFSQANSEEAIMLSGKVVDTLKLSNLADVVVVNKRTNKTTITDKDGVFFILMKKTDTIYFYYVGYRPKNFYFKSEEQLKKKFHVIFLKQESQYLEEVEISSKKEKEKKFQYPDNRMPATIENPISFIFEKYSKRYEQYRKVEKLEKEKYYRQLKELRFQRDMVLELTDISEKDVDKFMDQCLFTDEFLETASDYEFLVAIQKKYRLYKNRYKNRY
jgi:hypothetical protein